MRFTLMRVIVRLQWHDRDLLERSPISLPLGTRLLFAVPATRHLITGIKCDLTNLKTLLRETLLTCLVDNLINSAPALAIQEITYT
jgi:hypothetical protein